ncbi:hypothetical protein GEMRC1_011548 [Eukaryota sp. GEM-RC1]
MPFSSPNTTYRDNMLVKKSHALNYCCCCSPPVVEAKSSLSTPPSPNTTYRDNMLVKKSHALNYCCCCSPPVVEAKSSLSTPPSPNTTYRDNMLVKKSHALNYCCFVRVTESNASPSHSWLRNLTMDGDVESNPGPFPPSAHSGCAFISHESVIHPVKNITGHRICTCLEHYHLNASQSVPEAMTDRDPISFTECKSQLDNALAHFDLPMKRLSVKNIYDYITSFFESLIAPEVDHVFVEFLEYHNEVFTSIDLPSLKVLPSQQLLQFSAQKRLTIDKQCSSYAICNQCMLPRQPGILPQQHDSTRPVQCCLTAHTLDFSKFIRVVNPACCLSLTTMLTIALTLCHQYLQRSKFFKDTFPTPDSLSPFTVDSAREVKTWLRDLTPPKHFNKNYLEKLLNEIVEYAEAADGQAVLSEQTTDEADEYEQVQDFNNTSIDMSVRIENYASRLLNVDAKLQDTWIFRSLYRFYVFAKTYLFSNETDQENYRNQQISSIYLLVFMLGYQSYIISTSEFENCFEPFVNLMNFPFVFISYIFNGTTHEEVVEQAIKDALKYKTEKAKVIDLLQDVEETPEDLTEILLDVHAVDAIEPIEVNRHDTNFDDLMTELMDLKCDLITQITPIIITHWKQYASRHNVDHFALSSLMNVLFHAQRDHKLSFVSTSTGRNSFTELLKHLIKCYCNSDRSYDLPYMITGSTGSGKSTLSPVIFALTFFSKVIVSQPTVPSAIFLSEFLNSLTRPRLGSKFIYDYPIAGYHCGGGVYNFSDNTLVHYQTTGLTLMLLMNQHSFVSTYKVVIVDEVHDRTIDVDLLLTVMKINLKNSGIIRGLSSATIGSTTAELNPVFKHFAP